MILKNTDDSYGLVSKLLHWGTALVILGLLPLGFYMSGLDFSEFKMSLYRWHKSLGVLVLFLFVLRVGWRFTSVYPASLPSHKKWEKGFAHFVHLCLYLALLAMPLSGWLMSSSGGYAVSFFGLFEMPALVGKDEAFMDLMREAHEVIAFALLGLLALHVAGALKHHVIDKDQTLLRMASKLVLIVMIPVFLASFAATGFFVAGEEEEEEASVQKEVIETPAVTVDEAL